VEFKSPDEGGAEEIDLTLLDGTMNVFDLQGNPMETTANSAARLSPENGRERCLQRIPETLWLSLSPDGWLGPAPFNLLFSGKGEANLPPASEGDERPDSLHQAEGPGPLQKTIGRPQDTGSGESQDEPGTALFQGVKNEHQRDGQQAKQGQRIHRHSSISRIYPYSIIKKHVENGQTEYPYDERGGNP